MTLERRAWSVLLPGNQAEGDAGLRVGGRAKVQESFLYQRLGFRLFCAVTNFVRYCACGGETTSTTVGVDIVDVRRVARLIGRPRAAERLLTEGELNYCFARLRSTEHVAARFAAKEAVFKAFGTGLGSGVSWKDVEVVRGEAGEPQVRLHGVAAALAQRRRLTALAISLSHTSELAIAHAVAGWLSRRDEEAYDYDEQARADSIA